jgi:hypothetical protein
MALGWLLHIATLGYLDQYQCIRAWMHGRRVDHIYISWENPPPALSQLGEMAAPAVGLRSAKEQKRIRPAVALSNVLSKKLISLRNTYSIPHALNIILFADKNQDVFPVLEEYFREKKFCVLQEKDVIRPIIKVIEQSQGLRFGGNGADDIKIISVFVERLLRRAFHGTSKIAAKSILQNGISYERTGKGFDYDELDFLISECRLRMSSFYELHKAYKKGDACSFYVSQNPENACVYAQNNGPEWFNRLREWGKKDNGEFDRLKFQENLLKANPECTDVERVTRFAEKHWNVCASHKKNAVVLIVEKEKQFCMQDLRSLLSYNASENFRTLISISDFRGLITLYAQRIQPRFEMSSLYQKNALEALYLTLNRLSGDINEHLGKDNTTKPPKVIHAIKVPLFSSPLDVSGMRVGALA